MTASLGICCHAGAETLTVASTAAGTCVRQAVHVEPGYIHLNIKKNDNLVQKVFHKHQGVKEVEKK